MNSKNIKRLLFVAGTALSLFIFTASFTACSSHILDIQEGLQSTSTPTQPASTPTQPSSTPETTPPPEPTPTPTPAPTPTQPQERSYFSLESNPRGIKLILDDDVTLQEYGGSSINVEGIPIKISNMDWTKKEFIFPFVTQGQTYSVELWANIIIDNGAAGNTQKYIEIEGTCEAGGGIDYTQYINTEPLENLQIDVDYNGSYFIVDYMAQAGTVFIDPTPINTPKFELELWIGKRDWSKTTNGGYYQETIPNQFTNYNRSGTTTFTLSNLSYWVNYEYKYWARMSSHFYFDGF